MSSRGARLLSAGPHDRVEPLVTYRRLPPDVSSSDGGRVEPHFTAVRVDRDGRGARVDELPLVEAPPSDSSIDPPGDLSAGEIRQMLRPRGSRFALIAGVAAFVLGAGVLAATYGGVAKLDASPPEPSALVPASGEASQVAGLESEVAADPGRPVRVVAADPFASASETAALAPRAVADPVAGGAAPSDQATVSGEAALFAEPPGRVISNPPPPRLRPETASYHPAQAPSPSAVPETGVQTTVVTTAAPVIGPAPAAGAAPDVDSALANVDRILDEQRAATMMDGSGDGEFYGPLPPAQPVIVPVGPTQPVVVVDPYATSYPAPLPPPPVQLYPAQPVYPGPVGVLRSEPYGPPWPYGRSVVAEADSGPWWLPQRRAVRVTNPPLPPADIPGAPGGVW